MNYRRSYSYKEQDKIQCFSMLTRQIKIEALDLGVSREMNSMQHIYSEQKHITSLKALYFYRNDVILFWIFFFITHWILKFFQIHVYVYNHENHVSSRLSSQTLWSNQCTWAHDETCIIYPCAWVATKLIWW